TARVGRGRSSDKTARVASPLNRPTNNLGRTRTIRQARSRMFRLAATVALAKRGQQSRHQLAAIGETLHDDVLIQRVGTGALHAETIKRRNTHRSGKVAVRAAARTLRADVIAKTAGDAACHLI